jgi:hypothetical protein
MADTAASPVQTVQQAIAAGETLYPVAQLAREQLGMPRVSPPTIWRWCVKGSRAGKLDAVFIAGRWMTTRAALADYLRRSSAAQAAKCSGRNRGPIDATDDELSAAGLL